MLGTNELILNEGSMIEALQYFFDKVMFVEGKSPTIKSIKISSTNSIPEFKIAMESRIEKKEEKV